ncbi:MAG: DUF1015 domain-containing protein [Thermodesulfobacteriota bacterium]
MADIAPFRAVRFNPAKIERLEEVVSPPYDVLGPAAQAALEDRNPYNMIHLDLSKSAATKISDQRYEAARDTFASWQEENVLIRDAVPAIYLYAIDYTLPNGKTLRRKGFSALVGLHEFSEGVVKPHEKTFRSVTDDRLRLIDTCQAQFSQIFSLYGDEKGEVMAALEQAAPAEPIHQVRDQDGCLHTIWAVTQGDVIARVRDFFAGQPVYIADGHHRYTTSLRLRETMAERQGKPVAKDSPYNQIMMYLCPMEDEGLSVLPTHRLVRFPGGIDAPELVERLRDSFAVAEIKAGSREEQVAEVMSRMGDEQGEETCLGMYVPGSDRCFLLGLKGGSLEKELGEKEPAVLRDLDVVVLSDLVIAKLLGLSHKRCEEEDLVSYFSDPDEILDTAVKEEAAELGFSPIIFFMNHTLVSQVKEVADENLIMPHKSTYFYPKILTGLLMQKIVADEVVK